MDLRQELVGTFQTALAPIGMLDRFQISGIIASWWGGDNQADLKTLANIGFKGLIDAWVTTVLDALEEEKSKIDPPLDHKVARALLPEYLEGLAALEAEAAELGATVKAATANPEDDDAGEAEVELSPPAELKKLKSRLTGTKKRLKADKAAFEENLRVASEALDDTTARALVLDLFRFDLLEVANRRVTRHRRLIIECFETWWDKYYVTLAELETERDSAARKLAEFLVELGYE